MKLSVREAATLLGRSPRTIRAQLARGDLPGKKQGGEWRIERRHLPLTEAQRGVLQDKADRIRRTVDEALPSRMARTAGQKSRSIADLYSFRRGAEILTEIRSAIAEALREAIRLLVVGMLEDALLALAEGVQLFDRELKLEAPTVPVPASPAARRCCSSRPAYHLPSRSSAGSRSSRTK